MNDEVSSDGILSGKLMDVIKRRTQLQKESDYQKWCNDLASLPENSGRRLKHGFIADLELQPSRWLQHGLDLIGSRRAFGTVQLMGGIAGPDFRSFLPYPVFQMGVEIFLKGMWLYQHKECRDVLENSYVAPQRRKHFLEEIKEISRRHDLLEIIAHVKSIKAYSQNAQLSRFLKIVGQLSRIYYLPVMQGKLQWSDERYPKRFYQESSKSARADAHHTYPEHWLIARLFADAADRVEFVWRKGKAD